MDEPKKVIAHATTNEERTALSQLFECYTVCEKCGAAMTPTENWYDVEINTALEGGMIDMPCPSCGHVHVESIQFHPKYMPTLYNALVEAKREMIMNAAGASVNGAVRSAQHVQPNNPATRRPRNIQEAAQQRLMKRRGGK